MFPKQLKQKESQKMKWMPTDIIWIQTIIDINDFNVRRWKN